MRADKAWITEHSLNTRFQSFIWAFPEETPLPEVKRPRSVGKKIVETFSSTRDMAMVILEKQCTIAAQWHSKVCLPTAFKKNQGSNQELA